MAAVVLLDPFEDPLDPPLVERVLEDEPRGEGIPMKTPGDQDRVGLPDQLRGTVRLSLGGEHLGEVDRDEHELMVEVAGPQLLPELPEDVLRTGEVAKVPRDPPFDSAQSSRRGSTVLLMSASPF